jgi:hypothetical protein
VKCSRASVVTRLSPRGSLSGPRDGAGGSLPRRRRETNHRRGCSRLNRRRNVSCRFERVGHERVYSENVERGFATGRRSGYQLSTDLPPRRAGAGAPALSASHRVPRTSSIRPARRAGALAVVRATSPEDHGLLNAPRMISGARAVRHRGAMRRGSA